MSNIAAKADQAGNLDNEKAKDVRSTNIIAARGKWSTQTRT